MRSRLRWMWIAVRGRGDAAQLTETARTAVRSLDRDLPLLSVRTMREVISDSLSEPRLLMQFLAGFALFALLIDAIGIYGIVEFSVRQRTHEVGIRMALGATYGSVVRLILQRGIVPAAAGACWGAGGTGGIRHLAVCALRGRTTRSHCLSGCSIGPASCRNRSEFSACPQGREDGCDCCSAL